MCCSYSVHTIARICLYILFICSFIMENYKHKCVLVLSCKHRRAQTHLNTECLHCSKDVLTISYDIIFLWETDLKIDVVCSLYPHRSRPMYKKKSTNTNTRDYSHTESRKKLNLKWSGRKVRSTCGMISMVLTTIGVFGVSSEFNIWWNSQSQAKYELYSKW